MEVRADPRGPGALATPVNRCLLLAKRLSIPLPTYLGGPLVLHNFERSEGFVLGDTDGPQSRNST